MRSHPFLLLAGALLFAACGDGGTESGAIPTSVRASHGSIVLDDGTTGDLTAEVLDQDGAPIPGPRPTWRSRDTAVVTVGANGRLTAVRPGLTDVLASYARDSAVVRVLVRRVATQLAAAGGNDGVGVPTLALGSAVVMRVTDRHGSGVPGILVHFQADHGSIAPPSIATDAEGYVAVAWTLGPGAGVQTATAVVDGLAPVQLSARAIPASATAMAMLAELDANVTRWLTDLRELLPRNPGSATWINAKIAMLESPTLRADIVRDRRWVDGSVASSDGVPIPVTALFALEGMRAEATRSVRAIEAALPVLETFMATPFPARPIRTWQGFVIGNSGGGGSLFMEDQATYEARTPATRLPYEAILVHELSHSYIGSEPLNQFLELYQYNVVRTGSTDVATWTFTRAWTPGLATNAGVHALLDVYALVGHDAMSRAYRAVYPLRPPFAQVLSAQARQVFVDAAPDAAKAQVAALMERVTL